MTSSAPASRHKTAFEFYRDDVFDQVKEELGNDAPKWVVSHRVAEYWANLPSHVRRKYIHLGEVDRTRVFYSKYDIQDSTEDDKITKPDSKEDDDKVAKKDSTKDDKKTNIDSIDDDKVAKMVSTEDDKNEPRHKTAFEFYRDDVFDQVKEELGNDAPKWAVSHRVAEYWANLPSHVRRKYIHLGEVDRTRVFSKKDSRKDDKVGKYDSKEDDDKVAKMNSREALKKDVDPTSTHSEPSIGNKRPINDDPITTCKNSQNSSKRSTTSSIKNPY